MQRGLALVSAVHECALELEPGTLHGNASGSCHISTIMVNDVIATRVMHRTMTITWHYPHNRKGGSLVSRSINFCK